MDYLCPSPEDTGVDALTPSGGIRRRGCGGQMSWGGALMNGVSALMKGPPGALLIFPPEDALRRWPCADEPSPIAQPCWPLDLGLLVPEPREINAFI